MTHTPSKDNSLAKTVMAGVRAQDFMPQGKGLIPSWLTSCLLGVIILVSGCQPGASLKYNQGMSTATANKNNVSAQKVAAKPYTGNIELKFDTALLKGYKGPHKVLQFSSFTAKSKGFKTQSLLPGPQVWESATLTRTTGQPDEFDLTFTAPVGTYFLRVHNGDAND